MSKFHIDMPDDIEIQNQIYKIVDQGVEEKEKFHVYLTKMYKQIGFKNLFHDLTEIYFVCGVVAFIILSSIILINKELTIKINPDDYVYMFIFTISPLLYLSINIVSFININENKTYEQEMVCKYNIYQVSALRMLIFSVLCMVSNTIVLMPFKENINLLRGLMISITSLFLFSNLFLYSMLQIKSRYSKFIVVGIWILTNGALNYINNELYKGVLSQLPIYIYLIISIACLYAYIRNIKKLERYKYEPFGI